MKIVTKRDKQYLNAELTILAGYIRATFDREKNSELFDKQIEIIREIGHHFGIDDMMLTDSL